MQPEAEKLFSLAQIADLIATANDQSEERAHYLHRRFRELYRQRVLTAVDFEGQGRTATALFDKATIFQAALIVHVSDSPWHFNVGDQAEFLKAISEASAHFPLGKQPTGARKAGIEYAIEGIRKGESWSLSLHVWRDDTKTTRDNRMGAAFRMEGVSKRVERAMALAGKPTLGRLDIPLADIFLPILSAIG